MDLTQYRDLFNSDDAAPGWDAIDGRLKEVYPGQEPRHFGTVVKYMLGSPDPIDGISIYKCKSGEAWHYHYVTYGFSCLYYDEEALGAEYSGWGFELTFRLVDALETEPPVWVCNLLQNIARYVFSSKKWFDDNHWMSAGGPIFLESDTDITGLAFVTDPVLGVIDSPHGRVQFLQVVGLTTQELQAVRDGRITVPELLAEISRLEPMLETDLSRKSVL